MAYFQVTCRQRLFAEGKRTSLEATARNLRAQLQRVKLSRLSPAPEVLPSTAFRRRTSFAWANPNGTAVDIGAREAAPKNSSEDLEVGIGEETLGRQQGTRHFIDHFKSPVELS